VGDRKRNRRWSGGDHGVSIRHDLWMVDTHRGDWSFDEPDVVGAPSVDSL
jgi:hypothetical protein